MLKKTLQIIKNNPAIYLIYGASMVINVVILILLYPNNMNTITDVSEPEFALVSYLMILGKLFLASLLIFIISLFFTSGIGNAVREATFSGRTSFSAFFPGIKIYFVRVLLAMLLITAMVFAASMLLGILTIPITMMTVMNGTTSPVALMLIISIVSVLLILIPMPFLLLWIPAMFLENTGVIHSLNLGAKAGTKNYIRLFVGILLLFIPEIIYFAFYYDEAASGHIFTVGYFLLMAVMMILSLVFYVYLFEVYHEYRISQMDATRMEVTANH